MAKEAATRKERYFPDEGEPQPLAREERYFPSTPSSPIPHNMPSGDGPPDSMQDRIQRGVKDIIDKGKQDAAVTPASSGATVRLPVDHEAVGVGQDTGIVGPYPEGSDMVNPGMRPPEPTNIGEIFAHPPVKENMGFYGKGFGVPGELPPHLANKEPKSLDTTLEDIFGAPPAPSADPTIADIFGAPAAPAAADPTNSVRPDSPPKLVKENKARVQLTPADFDVTPYMWG